MRLRARLRKWIADRVALSPPVAETASEEHDLYHRSIQISVQPDWLDLAAAAQRVRVAGSAFILTLHLSGQVEIDTETRERLKKRVGKALTKTLSDDYGLESLKVTPDSIVIEVTAATTHRRSRVFPVGSLPPWADEIDSAMEKMRREVRDVLRAKVNPELDVVAEWVPGRHVFAEEVSSTDSAPLAAVRESLRERTGMLTRLESVRQMLMMGTALLGILAPILIVKSSEVILSAYAVIGLLYALALLLVLHGRVVVIRAEVQEIKEGLELRGLLNDEERRAFRLYQLHNLDLKRYYDLALSQRRVIFGLGTFCIALGSGVAITALILLAEGGTTSQQKLLITGVGAVGAILANFVAVIYLRMFRDTVSSMNTFHNRLVSTHHLLFGNLLVARIGNRIKRDDALAQMASSITDPEPQEE
jgi:hypothetical protein